MSDWWGAAPALAAGITAVTAARLRIRWLPATALGLAFIACPLLVISNALNHAWLMAALFAVAEAAVCWLAPRTLRP
jgi:hypothetical protein